MSFFSFSSVAAAGRRNRCLRERKGEARIGPLRPLVSFSFPLPPSRA